MRFAGVMVSCPARLQVREESLRDLANTDWGDSPVAVVEDDQSSPEVHARIRRTWQRAIEAALVMEAEFILLMEDDISFNRHLKKNLGSWDPIRLREGHHAFFASLYNPGFQMRYCRPQERYAAAYDHLIWGAQTYVVSRATAGNILDRWGTVKGAPDQMMPRIASQSTPILYHLPSLVQHRAVTSTWGGRIHSASDFDPDWLAAESKEGE